MSQATYQHAPEPVTLVSHSCITGVTQNYYHHLCAFHKVNKRWEEKEKNPKQRLNEEFFKTNLKWELFSNKRDEKNRNWKILSQELRNSARYYKKKTGRIAEF